MFSVDGDIRAARAQAVALLIDSVSIGRPVESSPVGRYAGPRTTYAARTVSPVRALVQAATAYASRTTGPEVVDVRGSVYVVKVPVGTVVEVGDKIVPVVCVLTPALVGVSLYVESIEASSLAVLWRLTCTRTVPANVRP